MTGGTVMSESDDLDAFPLAVAALIRDARNLGVFAFSYPTAYPLDDGRRTVFINLKSKPIGQMAPFIERLLAMPGWTFDKLGLAWWRTT